MSRPPMTRAYARIDGIKRELFKVRELTNGDLHIISNHPPQWFDKQGNEFSFGNQHYSVHSPNGGRDTEITQKTLLNDAELRSNTAYIHDTKDHLLWPVYARRFPHYDTKSFYSRPRDRSFRVAKFKYKYATLFYSLFVSRPDFLIQLADSEPATIHFVPFREFALVIIVTYINMPTWPTGDVRFRGTSTPKIGDSFSADHIQIYSKSVPKQHILLEHWDMVFALRDYMRQRIEEEHGEDAEYIQMMMEDSSFFTSAAIM